MQITPQISPKNTTTKAIIAMNADLMASIRQNIISGDTLGINANYSLMEEFRNNLVKYEEAVRNSDLKVPMMEVDVEWVLASNPIGGTMRQKI